MKLSLVESRLFGRICYGYRRDKNGIVEIISSEAAVVNKIFELYIAGNSLESIQEYLSRKSIPSPSGNKVWSRDVINKTLNNLRYILGIIDFKTYQLVQSMKTANCRNNNKKSERDIEW